MHTENWTIINRINTMDRDEGSCRCFSSESSFHRFVWDPEANEHKIIVGDPSCPYHPYGKLSPYEACESSSVNSCREHMVSRDGRLEVGLAMIYGLSSRGGSYGGEPYNITEEEFETLEGILGPIKPKLSHYIEESQRRARVRKLKDSKRFWYDQNMDSVMRRLRSFTDIEDDEGTQFDFTSEDLLYLATFVEKIRELIRTHQQS